MPRKKKCRNPDCRQWFEPFSSLAKACSMECALVVTRKDAEKRERKKTRQMRERIKTLSELCQEAQTEVNRYVRLRDADKGCISCGSPNVSDAGHFFHAGSKYRTSPLRLDPRNLSAQCPKCNRYSGGGNAVEYMHGYIKRHGQEAFDELVAYKEAVDRGEVPSLTKDEAREIKRKYRKLANELARR